MDLEKIIKTNKQNIKNIIRLITKEDNEDIEQEVYLKIWKNSDKYKEQGASKSWISMIAKNTSLDYLKSAYRKMFTNADADDYTLESISDKKQTPEGNVISIERRKKIISAIESLKPKFKEVILLTEIEGYTYEECAKKLKCPLGTIKSRVYNAKKELSIQLKNLI